MLIKVGIQVTDLDETDFDVFDFELVVVVVIARSNTEVTPVIQIWHVKVFETLCVGRFARFGAIGHMKLPLNGLHMEDELVAIGDFRINNAAISAILEYAFQVCKLDIVGGDVHVTLVFYCYKFGILTMLEYENADATESLSEAEGHVVGDHLRADLRV